MMIINASSDMIPLEDKSVHTVVTSPPYWALRRYSGDQGRQWPAIKYAPMTGLPKIEVPE